MDLSGIVLFGELFGEVRGMVLGVEVFRCKGLEDLGWFRWDKLV